MVRTGTDSFGADNSAPMNSARTIRRWSTRRREMFNSARKFSAWFSTAFLVTSNCGEWMGILKQFPKRAWPRMWNPQNSPSHHHVTPFPGGALFSGWFLLNKIHRFWDLEIPVQVPAIETCFTSIDEIARIFFKSQSLYRGFFLCPGAYIALGGEELGFFSKSQGP